MVGTARRRPSDPSKLWLPAVGAAAVIGGGMLLGAERVMWALRLLHGGVDYHPDASHSLLLGGRESVMCARNTGIYCGALLTALWAWGAGRGRAERFPPLRVGLALAALFGLMAADGLNSLAAAADYPPAYAPHNLLRLATGLGAGTAAAALFLPVLNGVLWRGPQRVPLVPSLRSLGGLLGVQAALFLLLAAGVGALALPLAGLTTASSLALFGAVNLLAGLLLLRRENRCGSLVELARPAGVAIGVALAQLAGLSWVVRGLVFGS